MYAVSPLRRTLAALSILLLLALAACAGGSGLQQTAPTDGDRYGHGWDGARSGSYVAIAVDAAERTRLPLTDRLRVSVEADRGGELVRIFGREVPGSNAWLKLRYDAETLHPRETQRGDGLPEDCLFLGLTQETGVVSLGLTTIHEAPLPGGEIELAQVRFARGAQLSRQSAAVTRTGVSDLRFEGESLRWSYAVRGDYDQNSEVNPADLAPIGAHFLKNTSSPDWAAAQVADGDKNGEINAADISPIGNAFREAITHYKVLAGPSSTGPFGDVTGGLLGFSEGLVPGGGGFRQYSFSVPAPVADAWYVVVAMENGAQSPTLSNPVQFGAGLPAPSGLTATDNGSQILLTWNAPTGMLPDGYEAFVASDALMSDAQQMNLGLITGTSFNCPAAVTVGEPHYFGVKAVYGTERSGYSNIFGYNTGGGGITLTAVMEGTRVRLNWTPAGAADGYDAFVADNVAMDDEEKLNNSGLITEETYLCQVAVDAAAEHWFRVVAMTGGSETDQSNVAHYTPGSATDTVPPVWQGGVGIRTAEPDNGLVRITWFPAIDATTPPVSYRIYYALDTQVIDWDTPVDVVAGTQTSYNALGLTNGMRYQFGVRAQDGVDPDPNVTSNTNVLFATPQVFPANAKILKAGLAVTSSDTASARMSEEEVPVVFAVDNSGAINYCRFNNGLWEVTDYDEWSEEPGVRKRHPQMVAVGDNVSVIYSTPTAVYEWYGPKHGDPLAGGWQSRTIATGLAGVYGTGLVYSEAGGYLAVVYAARSGGNEKLYYADRNLGGDWGPPVAIMDGNPEIWQCDLAINDVDGSQWAVAANGFANSSADELKFWYVKRDSRTAPWEPALNTGFGGDVMVVEIDPTLNKPLVSCAEVTIREVQFFGPAPVSDATIFTWTGTNWQKNTLEQGDIVFNQGDFTLTTTLTGQDPQLVFSPSGKAVTLWSKLVFWVDLLESEATLTGDWRYSQRPEIVWSAPLSMLAHITSSNSVTAGESYQHCITCDLGLQDSGSYTELGNKYSQRNDYVEGDLYYRKQAW